MRLLAIANCKVQYTILWQIFWTFFKILSVEGATAPTAACLIYQTLVAKGLILDKKSKKTALISRLVLTAPCQ